MSIIDKLKHPSVLAFLILLSYLSPYIFFSSHAKFLLHDNLDSNVVWYKMLAESGLMFSPNNAIFHNIYNGIPRGFMPSQFDIYVLSYLVLSPINAYSLNIIIIHIAAFIGMFLLLKDYVFKSAYPIHVAFLSLSFAVLPFWPSGELSIAGQPLIVWVFLNLLHKIYSLKNWLIICIFPFYSLFIFSNLFFLPVLFIFLIIYFILYKKINYLPLVALAILTILTSVASYRLFDLQFIDHVHAQRNSFSSTPLNFKGYLGTSLLLFLKGQYHFCSFQWPCIIILSIISLFIVREFKHRMLIASLIFACFICAALSNIYSFGALTNIFNKLGNLKSLQLRFTSMLPLLWHLIFALSIYFILLKMNNLKTILLGVILFNVLSSFINLSPSDYQNSVYNENAFYNTYFRKQKQEDYKSFKDYYSDSLFNISKQRIHYTNATILCIGFPSEIAQYNGIYTAAAYYTYYPAEKKQELTNIFLPELHKLRDPAKELEVINSRRFQYYFYTQHQQSIESLSLDTIGIKKMNIAYIFSSLSIDNYSTMHLDSIACIHNIKENYPSQIIIYKTN